MKEATGEANMTIVTVVLIGLITLIATPIIKGLVSSTKQRACCVNNGGQWEGGQCTDGHGGSVPSDNCNEE